VTAGRDHRDFLKDMVMACRSIIRFAEGMTLDGDLKPLLLRLEALAHAHGVAL
jgi:hypothetical protein